MEDHKLFMIAVVSVGMLMGFYDIYIGVKRYGKKDDE